MNKFERYVAKIIEKDSDFSILVENKEKKVEKLLLFHNIKILGLNKDKINRLNYEEYSKELIDTVGLHDIPYILKFKNSKFIKIYSLVELKIK